ncbi:MAG: hypothetical protein WDW36_001511 [Sanguina aurantia]
MGIRSLHNKSLSLARLHHELSESHTAMHYMQESAKAKEARISKVAAADLKASKTENVKMETQLHDMHAQLLLIDTEHKAAIKAVQALHTAALDAAADDAAPLVTPNPTTTAAASAAAAAAADTSDPASSDGEDAHLAGYDATEAAGASARKEGKMKRRQAAAEAADTVSPALSGLEALASHLELTLGAKPPPGETAVQALDEESSFLELASTLSSSASATAALSEQTAEVNAQKSGLHSELQALVDATGSSTPGVQPESRLVADPPASVALAQEASERPLRNVSAHSFSTHAGSAENATLSAVSSSASAGAAAAADQAAVATAAAAAAAGVPDSVKEATTSSSQQKAKPAHASSQGTWMADLTASVSAMSNAVHMRKQDTEADNAAAERVQTALRAKQALALADASAAAPAKATAVPAEVPDDQPPLPHALSHDQQLPSNTTTDASSRSEAAVISGGTAASVTQRGGGGGGLPLSTGKRERQSAGTAKLIAKPHMSAAAATGSAVDSNVPLSAGQEPRLIVEPLPASAAVAAATSTDDESASDPALSWTDNDGGSGDSVLEEDLHALDPVVVETLPALDQLSVTALMQATAATAQDAAESPTAGAFSKDISRAAAAAAADLAAASSAEAGNATRAVAASVRDVRVASSAAVEAAASALRARAVGHQVVVTKPVVGQELPEPLTGVHSQKAVLASDAVQDLSIGLHDLIDASHVAGLVRPVATQPLREQTRVSWDVMGEMLLAGLGSKQGAGTASRGNTSTIQDPAAAAGEKASGGAVVGQLPEARVGRTQRHGKFASSTSHPNATAAAALHHAALSGGQRANTTSTGEGMEGAGDGQGGSGGVTENPWTSFTRSTNAREVLTFLILLAFAFSLVNCLNNIHKMRDQEKSSRLDELQVNSDKVQGKFKHKLAEIRKMEAEVSRVEQNLHQFSLNMARGETNGGNFSGGISSGSAAKAIATASAADSDPADDPATTATTDFIPLQPTPSSSSQAGSNTRSRRRRRGGNFLRGGSGKPQSIQQGGAGGEKGGGRDGGGGGCAVLVV